MLKKINFIIFTFLCTTSNLQSMTPQQAVLQERIKQYVVSKATNQSIIIVNLLNQLPTIITPQNENVDLNNPIEIVAKLQNLEPYERLPFCMTLSPKQIRETSQVVSYLLKKNFEKSPAYQHDDTIPELIPDFDKCFDQYTSRVFKKRKK